MKNLYQDKSSQNSSKDSLDQIRSRISFRYGIEKMCMGSLKFVCLLITLFSFGSLTSTADVNVLIVGATNDSRDNWRINGGSSEAFNPTEIGAQLQNILGGAGLGTVNVVVEDRAPTNSQYTFPLISWFYYPYPADVETTTRWPNLRGENGTDWDYVVIIGDPYCMEQLPGMYAQGVAKVAEEVVKGGAEPILLMPWPAQTSTATVAHYKEVVYRAGRSSGYKVAPAALAWQANASPSVGGHPNTDGAYISAASIYSRIWNQSASSSTYVYNDVFADTTHTTVSSNIVTSPTGATQYTGKFTFQSPTIMKDDKTRFYNAYARGSSTESGFANAAIIAHDAAGVTRARLSSGRRELYTGRVGRYTQTTSGTGFGFPYHNQTPTNDIHHAGIFTDEIDLADTMLGQSTSYRLIPRRILWAEFNKEFPAENPKADGSHLANLALNASGTYMYTLVSARCPLYPKPDPVTKDWIAKKIGYVAAWNMGRCQTRAPGFKVLPSKSSRYTIDTSTPEVMTIKFILPPQDSVTVNVSSSNPNVTVSPQTLTFTPANYDQPQTVSVTPLASLAPGETTEIIYNTVSNDVVYDDLDDSWRYHVNTRPIANDKAVDVISGASVEILMTGTDSVDYTLGHENEDMVYSIEVNPSNGALTQIGNAVLIYTPNAGFLGQDSFTYTVNDGSGVSAPATVIINIVEGSIYGRNLVYNGNAELSSLSAHGWTSIGDSWSNRRALAPRVPTWPGHSVQGAPEQVSPYNLQQGYASFQAPGVRDTNAELYQDVDVSSYSDKISLGRQQFTVQGYCQANGDDASIIAECRAANGQVLSTHDSGIAIKDNSWDFKQLTFIPPVGTDYIRVRLYGDETGGRRPLETNFDSISLVALMPFYTFNTWSGDTDFSDDNNGDGVSNGIAYAIGADDASVVATDLLPTPELGDDPLYYVFCYRRSDTAHTDPDTIICAEYSLNIASWIECEEIEGNTDIVITETDNGYGAGVDKIEVKIKRSLANGKGLFCRLKVTQ